MATAATLIATLVTFGLFVAEMDKKLSRSEKGFVTWLAWLLLAFSIIFAVSTVVQGITS